MLRRQSNKDPKVKARKAANMKRYFEKLALDSERVSQRTLNAWSLQVRTRDEHTCQHCNHVGALGDGSIHAHHIKSKHLYPLLALDLDNGIALCVDCHYKVHTKRD